MLKSVLARGRMASEALNSAIAPEQLPGFGQRQALPEALASLVEARIRSFLGGFALRVVGRVGLLSGLRGGFRAARVGVVRGVLRPRHAATDQEPRCE